MTSPTPSRRAEAGLSMIEVLIAAAILLFIVLGLVPLFSMSIKSNLEGSQSTQLGNFARERLEMFWELPFNSPLLEVQAGTQRTFDEYYSRTDELWKVGVPTDDDPATWTRQTVIEQFTMDEVRLAEREDRDPVPEPAGAPSGDIQVKRLTVTVEQEGATSFFNTGKRLTVQGLKSQ